MAFRMVKNVVNKISIPSELKIKQKEYNKSGLYPIIDQGRDLIGGYCNDSSCVLNITKPVIVFGDHTCCIKYVEFPFCAGADGIKVLQPKYGVLTKYLYFGLMYLVMKLQNRGYGRHYQHIEKKELEFPPLPEQQRIVAKIEELFVELDNSVAMLKKVKEQLEVYSKSIYSHLILSNVEKVMVKDICNEIHIGPFGSTLHKVDYVVNGVPVINPSNIKNQQIIPDSRLSVTEKKAQELSSYKLQVGDIIMGRRGEMGRCAPVTKKENGYICGTGSLFFRLKPEYDNVLYSQILASQEVVSFLMEKAVGTTMKNLNEDIVSRILVPKITKSAGNKILETMQDTTKKCSDISCKLNQMEQQTDALRQSILKKAFGGEL